METQPAGRPKRMTRSMKRQEDRPPAKLYVMATDRAVAHQQERVHMKRKAMMAGLIDDDLPEAKKSAAPRLAVVGNIIAGTSQSRKRQAAIGWEDGEGQEDLRGSIIQDALSLEANTKVDYRNPPPGVLGAGKGKDHGLPEYEFRSVWQKTLPELTAKEPAPWRFDPAQPPEDLVPSVLSVVGSLSLGNKLSLDDIAKRGTNLNYDPDSFTPLVMRLKKPKATALVFKSGKMVVTGTKSEEECKTAARRIARMIEKMGYRVSVNGLQIQNISATCNLGFRVRVHLFGGDKLLSNQIGYHPELFTGVSIPLVKPKVKVMIFRTGSVLITGARAESELLEALRIVYPFAKMYSN